MDPDARAAQLHRDPERQPERGQVEVEAEELERPDGGQVSKAFLVVAEVDLAHARNERRQNRCQRG